VAVSAFQKAEILFAAQSAEFSKFTAFRAALIALEEAARHSVAASASL
jgi:hypothetical protein